MYNNSGGDAMKKRLMAILCAAAMTVGSGAFSISAMADSTEAAGETESEMSEEEKKAAFNGENLVVGVWGGTISDCLTKAVVEPMEEEYGCTIDLELGGTSERKAKLYAEQDDPSMDVFFLNIYESAQAVKDGVAEDVDPSLSNFKDLYPFAQTGGYGMSIMALGICYDTETTEPISSWKDLWRDDLKGKVAITTAPSFEDDSLVEITAQAWGLDPETQEDEIFQKIADLGPFPLIFSDLDELFLEMKQGTVKACVIFNSYTNDYKEQGYPIDFVYPSDPGAVLAKDTIVIAKNTKHDALAKEFVNRCIGKDCQTAYATQISFSPCNKTVEVPDDVAEKLVYGQDKIDSLTTLDWDYILQHEDEWTEKYNQILEGN